MGCPLHPTATMCARYVCHGCVFGAEEVVEYSDPELLQALTMERDPPLTIQKISQVSTWWKSKQTTPV
jgi:hypothetical protein